MSEPSTEPLREKFLRAFFPRVKCRSRQVDLEEAEVEVKDPLERFESAIIQAGNVKRREREDEDRKRSGRLT